jgi:alcohol dehydrogenase, propanol-preferring
MAGAVSKLEGLQRGDWVVIPGAGGGLGHLGVQIAARQEGYRVIAVDSGEEKRKLCLELGATEFVDFKDVDVEKRVKELTDGEGAHAVIVVPGSEKAYELAPKLIRNTGTLVCVGLPRGDFHVPVAPIEVANRGEFL